MDSYPLWTTNICLMVPLVGSSIVRLQASQVQEMQTLDLAALLFSLLVELWLAYSRVRRDKRPREYSVKLVD